MYIHVVTVPYQRNVWTGFFNRFMKVTYFTNIFSDWQHKGSCNIGIESVIIACDRRSIFGLIGGSVFGTVQCTKLNFLSVYIQHNLGICIFSRLRYALMVLKLGTHLKIVHMYMYAGTILILHTVLGPSQERYILCPDSRRTWFWSLHFCFKTSTVVR